MTDFADDLFRSVSHHAGSRGVDVNNLVGMGIDDDDARGNRVQDFTKSRLAFQQFLGGFDCPQGFAAV